ncbi:MAG: hypothetical protein IT380_30275 [Myxococcales bacterium]|nr:hypothetical protein [Myxococcales bacterium]
MRVAFYGNICNNLFHVARALRQGSDIDAHLFVDAVHDFQMQPESDDPSLKDNYPSWIHKRRYMYPWVRFAPWVSPLVAELRNFDVVVVSSNGPLYAQFSGKPTFFWVSGADLNVMPFPFDFANKRRGVKAHLDALLTAFWQRRGIRHSTEIWTQEFLPFEYSLEQLRVRRDQIAPVYFPLIVDPAIVKAAPRAELEADPQIAEIRRRSDFVVFHPSRIMIRTNPALPRARALVETKRNDRLLDGFAQFVKHGLARHPLLVMPERSASPDLDVARDLIARLGIGQHVYWARPPVALGFPRSELMRYYTVADVVADDFGDIGWFGSVAVEAAAVGTTLISHFDERVVSKMYPWHPFVSAREPGEIAAALERLFRSPEERARRGADGKRWFASFHSPAGAGRVYVDRFVELARRLGLPSPRVVPVPLATAS